MPAVCTSRSPPRPLNRVEIQVVDVHRPEAAQLASLTCSTGRPRWITRPREDLRCSAKQSTRVLSRSRSDHEHAVLQGSKDRRTLGSSKCYGRTRLVNSFSACALDLGGWNYLSAVCCWLSRLRSFCHTFASFLKSFKSFSFSKARHFYSVHVEIAIYAWNLLWNGLNYCQGLSIIVKALIVIETSWLFHVLSEISRPLSCFQLSTNVWLMPLTFEKFHKSSQTAGILYSSTHKLSLLSRGVERI